MSNFEFDDEEPYPTSDLGIRFEIRGVDECYIPREIIDLCEVVFERVRRELEGEGYRVDSNVSLDPGEYIEDEDDIFMCPTENVHVEFEIILLDEADFIPDDAMNIMNTALEELKGQIRRMGYEADAGIHILW